MLLPGLALLLALPRDPQATYHASDAAPLLDPMRPVTRIDRTSFTLQYWTDAPCETRVELRQSDVPSVAYGHDARNEKRITVNGAPGRESWHTLTVGGLQSGKRYYYRIWDPGAAPTDEEKRWGAGGGWRREFAVATQAPRGQKTIVHLPVKVLLMPNVVNVDSAYADPDHPAPAPPPLTPDEIQKIEDEYAVSSRFFWINSGMRLWVDYHIFVDGRLQRWGDEPPEATGALKGLPPCRSYAGQDFAAPGGGAWTIVDTKNPEKATNDPVVEPQPYSGQIEQAFPRRWNLVTHRWEFYNSGGGTFGVDDFPKGIPGRSQFLGGGDTAWLATHEFHHDLESQGQFSLSNREDDRIVFDHPIPRHRYVRADGSVDEMAWNTAGPHGEQWDVIGYWDRQVSDAQWLRLYFGEAMTVRDADEDGVPDDDPRLPLDEKRFGSSPRKKQTDGEIGDLDKIMESTWAPGPLQSSWTKPPSQAIRPNPTSPDSDGDGIPDAQDPYPLYSNPPLIVPMHPTIDGDPSEWAGVPVAASFERGGIRFTFKQAHDDYGYYGLYEVHGPWKRIDGTFDGEGKGMFSGAGVLGFQVFREVTPPGAAGPVGPPVTTKPLFGGAPGLKIAATPTADGTVIEFSLPNRGEGPWYWTGGGHEIGAALNVWDQDGHGYSAWEPYRIFYARMVEGYGKVPLPAGAPAEIQAGQDGVTVYRPDQLKAEKGWTVANGAAHHAGDESALYLDGLQAKDFDLLAVIDAKSDAVLAAFTKGAKQMTADEGYVGLVGGNGNTTTRLRIFGDEIGDDATKLTPGPHRVQLSRHEGDVWLLVDGKPVAYAKDPNPRAVVDRFAVLGVHGGDQTVTQVLVRQLP